MIRVLLLSIILQTTISFGILPSSIIRTQLTQVPQLQLPHLPQLPSVGGQNTFRRQYFQPLYSDRISNEDDTTQDQEEWTARLNSAEVEEVRVELIDKYLELGRSKEFAENEVDNFLADRERSEKFLDMRRIAKEAEIGAFSPQVGLQLGLAFILGLVLNVISRYWAAFSAAYPSADFADFIKQFLKL